MENLEMDDLFSSVIKATRTYAGNDPLLPWLQGINKIKNALPPEIANQKLPRFIEKCTRTFYNDKRYANDLRYLRLWIQLLEFVTSHGEVLSFMEKNKIGLKHALFYQAYALHYEKLRKYPEAESMYRLGIRRLAVPAESLQQSYDSFLQRMASRNRRKMRSLEARSAASSANINFKCNEKKLIESSSGLCIIEDVENGRVRHPKGQSQSYGSSSLNCQPGSCNHVEKRCAPQYVTHEALGQPESSSECKNNILECSKYWSPESLKDESTVIYTGMSTGGENCDKDVIKNGNLLSKGMHLMAGENGLKIEYGDSFKGKIDVDGIKTLGQLARGFDPTGDLASKLCSEDMSNMGKSVAGAVLSSNEVENACHHGLLDPTINTKEIMAGINHMFCQPLHGDQKSPSQRNNRTEQAVEIFQILPDKDLEELASECQSLSFNISKENNSSVSVPKGLQVFADENLICKSSNEVLERCSSGDSPPVKGLQIRADESFNDFQQRNISGEKGLSSDICAGSSLEGINSHRQLDKGTAAILCSEFCSEDTIIIRKFVDSAIVGGTEDVEDACHHGLVEPTINTKEAMADINDMFGKPLHFDNLKGRRPLRTETIKQPAESFQILADEDLEEGSKQQRILSNVFEQHDSGVSFVRDFHIFVDENIVTKSAKEVPKRSCSSGVLAPVQGLPTFAYESCEESQKKTSILCNISKEDGPFSAPVEVDQVEKARDRKECEKTCSSEEIGVQHVGEGAYPTASLPSNEDTIIIRKFVDSAIAGNPKEVEDASHHGLVEPTINTKEAMADINDMFGKPLHFGKLKTRSQPLRTENIKQSVESFQIFADELEEQCLQKQNFLSSALESHDSAVPSIKDICVFVDENLVLNEIPKSSCLTGELAPVQSLQALAEQRLKESRQKANTKCNISTDEGLLHAPILIFDDEKDIEGREENKMNNSEGLKGHGQLGKGAYPRSSSPSKFSGEDTTIIHKFVDSAIVGATEAGDAHPHGLVEPTINTKEAMADINDMFSKPLHLDKLNRRNPPLSTGTIKHPVESFQILADEDLEERASNKQCPLSNTFDRR